MEGWNTTWPSMPNTNLVDTQKVMNSQGKLITIEEMFLDIGKQMLGLYFELNLVA
jgi:hypothetical protein